MSWQGSKWQVSGKFAILIAGAALAALLAVPPAARAARPDRDNPAGRSNDSRIMFPGLHQMEIGLSDEQKEKITEILERQRHLLRAVNENEDLDREQKSEQVRAIRERYRRLMNDLLTEEQQEKLSAIFKRVRERSGEPGQNMVERVTVRLRLTDRQQETLQELVSGHAAELQQVIRDQDMPREEKGEAIAALREKLRREIEGILTEEQAELYEQMRLRIRRRNRKDEGDCLRPGRAQEKITPAPDRNGTGTQPLQRRGRRTREQ